jgi:hypothetical protein
MIGFNFSEISAFFISIKHFYRKKMAEQRLAVLPTTHISINNLGFE